MDTAALLGEEAGALLDHTCSTLPKTLLTLPGPDYLDRVMTDTDRPWGGLLEGNPTGERRPRLARGA